MLDQSAVFAPLKYGIAPSKHDTSKNAQPLCPLIVPLCQLEGNLDRLLLAERSRIKVSPHDTAHILACAIMHAGKETI